MGRCEAVDVRFLARWKKMSGASHPLNLGPIGLEPDQESGYSLVPSTSKVLLPAG